MNSNSQDYKNELALGILFFFICPALSFLYMIVQAYNGSYRNLTILSLSIAMVSLFTPPFADLYRHTLMYFEYEMYSNVLIETNGYDYIFYTLANIFAQNNIPLEYISFLFVFICYQVSFYLFREILTTEKAKNWSRNTRFMIFLCFLFVVPFIIILNGLRLPTAAYISLLAWYNLYRGRKLKGIILYTIAILMHFGAWLFLPVMLFTIFPVIKIGRNTFWVVLAILIFLGGVLLYIIPDSFIEALELEYKVNGYMEESKERFGDTMSFNGYIAMWLERFVLLMTLFLIIIKNLKLNHKTSSLIYFSLWFAALYYPFTVLFQRYAIFIVPLLIFIIIYNHNDNINSTRYVIKSFMFSTIIMTLSYMYGYRAPLMATNYYKMFYPSVVSIIQTDTHKNFEEALVPK